MKIIKKKLKKSIMTRAAMSYGTARLLLEQRIKDGQGMEAEEVREAIQVILAYQDYLEAEIQTLSRDILSLGKEILSREE